MFQNVGSGDRFNSYESSGGFFWGMCHCQWEMGDRSLEPSVIRWNTEILKRIRPVKYVYLNMLYTGKHRSKKVNLTETPSKYYIVCSLTQGKIPIIG